jgi:hypothetical protein
MALTFSSRCNAVPEPLINVQDKLQMHFQRIAEILRANVDMSVHAQMNVEWALTPLVAGLVGEGCEYIERNRGLGVPVAPMVPLQQGLWAWLGYQEEWDEERPNRNIRRFSFRSASMTIHFGLRGDLFKPQMFRAEWAGWARWDGSDYSFQASDAAHPHWQFDALDSLLDDDVAERAAILRDLLLKGVETPVRDFRPQMAGTEIRDVITTQKLSRIHFASAAAWWKLPPLNGHAHCPSDATDVETWLRYCLAYLKPELERLQAG